MRGLRHVSFAILLGLLLLSTGCSLNRPVSTLSYTAPSSNPGAAQETIMLPATVAQTRKAALLYIANTFPGYGELQEDKGKMSFTAVLDDASTFVDCGELSVKTPSAQKTPSVFSGAAPTAYFRLADGSSVAKPAGRAVTAALKTILEFTPQGKSTLLAARTHFELRTRADYYTMITGFSVMMPYQVSKLSGVQENILFDTGEVGRGQNQTPKAHNVTGQWPVQCVSTRAFERALLQGIQQSLHESNEGMK